MSQSDAFGTLVKSRKVRALRSTGLQEASTRSAKVAKRSASAAADASSFHAASVWLSPKKFKSSAAVGRNG